jgi:hypothetical protein
MSSSNKCFSSCRYVAKSKCNLPICAYANGKTRKYCRLSPQYILKKNKDGQCITKKRQEIRTDAKRRIGKFMVSAHAKIKMEKQRLVQISKIKDSLYSHKIKKFMRNTTQKRRAEFLKAICSDSGVCIAFGQEEHKIKDFFNGFTKFDFVDGPIKRRGVPSKNGFIHEIAYSKGGYNAYSILKSSSNKEADNLYYEYTVGRYLNTLYKKVPCFVETYGLFGYVDVPSWKYAKDHAEIQPSIFSTLLQELPNTKSTLRLSCNESIRISVMTQHIKNAETLKTLLDHHVAYEKSGSIQLKQEAATVMSMHLPAILFQIYFALSLFMNTFTHYDLHADNVLLYIPNNNKYIHYHYHNPDGSITEFKSKYFVKIIDYGRSYFQDNHDRVDSHLIQHTICNESVCNTPYTGTCGDKTGYAWLFPDQPAPSNHYITSWRRNYSHDLRLLYILKTSFGGILSRMNKVLLNILDKVVFDEIYGTKEIIASGLPNKIHNVKDAFKELRSYMNTPITIQYNTLYYDYNPKWSRLGDLHIYSDGSNMRFDKA